MVNPKNAPIIKKGAGPKSKPGFEGPKEPFSLRLDFKHNNIRISYIPQQSTVRKTAEPTKDDEKLNDQISRERQFLLQAAIVKIMKTRKDETHQQLI